MHTSLWRCLVHASAVSAHKFQAGGPAMPPDKFANPPLIIVQSQHEAPRNMRILLEHEVCFVVRDVRYGTGSIRIARLN